MLTRQTYLRRLLVQIDTLAARSALRLLLKVGAVLFLWQFMLPASAHPMSAAMTASEQHLVPVLAAPQPLPTQCNVVWVKVHQPKEDMVIASGLSPQQEAPQAAIRIGVTLQSILINFESLMLTSAD